MNTAEKLINQVNFCTGWSRQGNSGIRIRTSRLGFHTQTICRAVLVKIQDRGEEINEELVGRQVLQQQGKEVGKHSKG